MIFEIWSYNATLPNNGGIKPRPVLIIGNDENNGLKIVDIHYCIISASSPKGVYDIEINEETALNLGLKKASIIKTTKIYTGSQNLLNSKICDLPKDIRDEFIKNYKAYQDTIMKNMSSDNTQGEPN